MASANSLTLADIALQSNDPLVQKVSFSLIMAGNVMQDIPLDTFASFKANGVRFQAGGLPTVNWRPLNQDPLVTKGTPTAFQEQAFTLSNSIDIDSKLLRDVNNIQNPFATQLTAYLKGVTYDMNYKFIKNDYVTGDENSFLGLRWRLDNPTVFGIPTEMKIDAAGIDVGPSRTATTANTLLILLEQLLTYMDAPDGQGVVLYCNDYMMRSLTACVRILGAGAGFNVNDDPFQRKVMMFHNAQIRDIGRKADQVTRIILNTENSDGTDGTSTFTSIYGVKYGDEDAFKGWQFDPLEQSIIGPYLLPNGIQQRLTVDWTVGLYQEHVRAIGRIYDLNNVS